MSMTEMLPLIDSLPHADKFRLIQFLLSKLAMEEGISFEPQKTALSQHDSSLKPIYQFDSNAHNALAPGKDWLLMTPEEQRYRLNCIPSEYEKDSSEELIRIIEESHLNTDTVNL
jgi:hypothetical protein